MNLLAIDTSTDFCSVAASRGETLFFRHEAAGQRHAEMILGTVETVLAEAGLQIAQIEGIAYGAGPGSFTGLRIAAVATLGLALAGRVGVVGVGTLLARAEEAAGERIISCLDAHMGEVYHAAYRRAGARWEEVSAPGLYKPEAVPVVPGAGWTGCGDGFAAYRERLAARLGGCVSAVRSRTGPTARAVLRLATPYFPAGARGGAPAAVPAGASRPVPA